VKAALAEELLAQFEPRLRCEGRSRYLPIKQVLDNVQQELRSNLLPNDLTSHWIQHRAWVAKEVDILKSLIFSDYLRACELHQLALSEVVIGEVERLDIAVVFEALRKTGEKVFSKIVLG